MVTLYRDNRWIDLPDSPVSVMYYRLRLTEDRFFTDAPAPTKIKPSAPSAYIGISTGDPSASITAPLTKQGSPR